MNIPPVKLKKIIQLSLFLILFVLFTVILLRPVQKELLNKIDGVQTDLIQGAETILGASFSYSNASLSFPVLLDIKDASLSNDALEGSARRIRIGYSLSSIIEPMFQFPFNPPKIENIFNSLKSITIDNLHIKTKIANSENASDSNFNIDDIKKIIKEIASFFPESITVTINRFTLEMEGENFSLIYKQGTILAKASQDEISAKIDGKIIGDLSTAKITKLNKGNTVSLSSNISAKLVCWTNEESARLSLRLEKLESSLADIKTLGITAAFHDNNLYIEKIGEALPYQLKADINLSTKDINAYFFADNFAPEKFILLKGGFSKYASFIPASISGGVETNFNANNFEDTFFVESNLNAVMRRDFVLPRASFTVNGSGTMKKAQFTALKAQLKEGVFSFSGVIEYKNLVINGNLSIKDFILQKDNPINGNFLIETNSEATSFFTRSLFLGKTELSDFNLNIKYDTEIILFDMEALRFSRQKDNKENFNTEMARIGIEGFYSFKEKNIDAGITLAKTQSEDIINIVGAFTNIPILPDVITGIIKNTKLSADIFFTTNFKNITYTIPALLTVYDNSGSSITSTASLSGTENHLAINELILNVPSGAISLLCDFDFTNINDIFFRIDAAYKDLFYYFEGEALDLNSVSITGSYGLEAFFSLSNTGSFSGFLRLERALLPYKEQIVPLSITAFVRYDSLDSWYIELESLELQNILIGSQEITRAHISGLVNQAGLTFQSVSIADAEGVLYGNADADWNKLFSEIVFSTYLSTRTSGESFFVNGIYTQNKITAHVSASILRLSRFIKNSANLKVSGIFDFNYSASSFPKKESWQVDLDISSLSGVYSNTDFNISTKGILENNGFSLHNTRINYGGFLANIKTFSLDNELLKLDTEFSGQFLGRILDAEIRSEINFEYISSILEIEKAFSVFQGNIFIARMKLDNWELSESAGFIFSRKDSLISVHGDNYGMLRLEITEGGDFYGSLGSPSPIQGALTGSVKNGNINARANNLYIDIPSLMALLPEQNVIYVTDGFAFADIEVRGPVSDPEFYGSAQGVGVQVALPQYLAQPVGPAPMSVELSGQTMRFMPIYAPCGKGFGTINGVFYFNRWVPRDFTITVDVAEQNSIPYNINISGVKSYGNVHGILEISQAGSALNITGNLTGENTIVTVDAENFENAPPQNVIQTIVNLNIKTGRRVEFLWPNETLPILRANTVYGNEFHIYSDSFAGNFELKGDIEMRSGEIFYIERNFYLRTGKLYLNENETQFRPMIEARAEIRDRTEDSPVTISLVIDRQPLLEFQARFESSPALSQSEILSLLGQSIVGGQTKESGEVTGAFGGAITDMLSQFSVVRGAERFIRDILGVDMFSVRTQALTNVFLQVAGASPTPFENDTNATRLNRYLDNTTVFLGKYINSDIFLQGMLSLRLDDEKFEQRGEQALRFEPEIGIEFKSPLFDIRWNIAPVHTKSLFLEDTSFTFVWRRSF